jgi:hypothetical protein
LGEKQLPGAGPRAQLASTERTNSNRRREMRAARSLALLAAAAMPLAAAAQQHQPQQPATRPPREASQYDFLVGHWKLTVSPKVSSLAARIHGVPKLRGSWKAWRALDGWGVVDELRIVDESGNPQGFTHFVRVYDATAKRWTIASLDVYRQQLARSTAQWQGSEMVTTSDVATDADGKSYVTRTRVTAITPTSFRYQQDRSYDAGKTWDEGRLVITAKRIAATAAR